MVAAIEAPLTLLQKPVEILLFDAVKFTHVTLCLIPEILDAVDVIFTSGKQLGMVDTMVIKLRYIQRIITTKIIGIHR